MATLYRTDKRIWATISFCAFVAMGFVDLEAGAIKGVDSFWYFVGVFIRGEYICDTSEILAVIMFQGVALAVLAIVGGWVAQALIVIGWRSLRGRTAASDGIHTATHS